MGEAALMGKSVEATSYPRKANRAADNDYPLLLYQKSSIEVDGSARLTFRFVGNETGLRMS